MKCLLVDDHALIRDALAQLLSQQSSDICVLQASSIAQAQAQLNDHPDIDIVLLDIQLPDQSGLSFLQTLKQQYPSLPVAMISGLEDTVTIHNCLQAGAQGFIPKSFDSHELINAIRTLLNGEHFVPEAYSQDAQSISQQDPRHILTPRQLDVLAALSKGLSNKEIARDLHMSPSTVKVHVAAILKALGVDNRLQAANLHAQFQL